VAGSQAAAGDAAFELSSSPPKPCISHPLAPERAFLSPSAQPERCARAGRQVIRRPATMIQAVAPLADDG